ALLWVKTAPGDRAVLDPPAGPPVTRLERRENGEIVWTATAWRSGPAEVRVMRAGAEALRETVQ
nr:hypothetical protein [Deltaproteobacteria bacterium]